MCGYNNEESICETMILKAGLFLDASALQWCGEMPSLTWVYCGKNSSQFKCTVTPSCGKIISQYKCTTMKRKDKFLNICVLQWRRKIQLWIYKYTAMMWKGTLLNISALQWCENIHFIIQYKCTIFMWFLDISTLQSGS